MKLCPSTLDWRGHAFPCEGNAKHRGMHICLIPVEGNLTGQSYYVALYWIDEYQEAIKPWLGAFNRDELRGEENV